MRASSLLLGAFTCPIAFELVRPATVTRHEEDGVTYVTRRDYELAYRTVLRFADDAELPVTAKLFGELGQFVVIGDEHSRPTMQCAYVQGRSEIYDAAGNLIFDGRYYDSRVINPLTGDDALTLTGTMTADHYENGFGRGAYAGHAFTLGVHLTRDNAGGGQAHGEATGHID